MQGGRQDFQSEGALFNDDVIMTSLLLDFNPQKVGGAPPLPTPLSHILTRNAKTEIKISKTRDFVLQFSG